jgi:ribosomal protein S18 acetylase RimI-like enzyme
MMQILQARSEPETAETRKLFQEYQEALGVDLEFQGFAAEVETLPGDYAPPRGRLLLAWEGDCAVGCIALRPLAEAICEMKRLYVRTYARSCGVGRLLVERAIAEARAAGYERMNLDTLPTMEGALRPYQRLGFRDIPAYCHNPIAGARYLALDLR